jgi:predicted transcriptional regulator
MSTATETLSIRLDKTTKRRLDILAKRSRRSKSFLAAEAIGAYVESEEWQLGEIQAGLKELDEGKGVAHDEVARWLRTWGRRAVSKTPK